MSTLAGAAVNRLKLNEFAEPGRQWPYECCKDCWLPTTDDYIAACEARGWDSAETVTYKSGDRYIRYAKIRKTPGDLEILRSGPSARAALEAAILSALEDEK